MYPTELFISVLMSFDPFTKPKDGCLSLSNLIIVVLGVNDFETIWGALKVAGICSLRPPPTVC